MRIILKRKSFGLIASTCLLLVAGTRPAYAQTVDAFRLDGGSITGKILAIRDREVTLAATNGSTQLSFTELERVVHRVASPKSGAAGERGTAMDVLSLVDGSQIKAVDFQGKDDQWTAKLIDGESFQFPKGSLSAVRFQEPSPALLEQWIAAVKEEATGDRLVVVRPGDTLDVVPGVLGEITAATVDFSLDGQVIQAPRAKLLGVIWYRPRNKRVEPTMQIELTDGSRWEATSMDYSLTESSGKLHWKTRTDLEASTDWSHVAAMNFSVANVVWLSSQVSLDRTTASSSLSEAKISHREAMLGPRFVAIDGKSDAKSKDLRFLAPGRISFRVPEGFTKFVARLHRGEDARFRSPLICEVLDGETVVWTKELRPTDQEATVEALVSPGKKLTLTVKCDSELMLGTEIFWDQPRLTR